MCGRYTLTKPNKIAERFDTEPTAIDLSPNFNAAPTQTMPVVRAEEEGNVIELMKWGLVPPWSKDGKMSFSTINARAEGLEDKPTYRVPFRRKRCIIPADGFYEWKKTDGSKQPYYFELTDHELLAFAGLWDSWRGANGEELHTYTIVTTQANELMAPIHDRMPVILEKQYEEPWLDTNIEDVHLLHTFLKPYDSSKMSSFRVSKEVNVVKTNNATLVEPMESK